MFIAEFTRVRHWFLSCATRIQLASSPPVLTRSILILEPHLRLDLQSGLFPSDVTPKLGYEFKLSPLRSVCTVHYVLRGF
jgi:hypothetical protein